MNKCNVVVLLGTYNGQHYLEQQIRSLQKQSFADWRLIVRDDGSDDATKSILKNLHRHDNRISLIVDDNENLGLLGNYNKLCQVALDEHAEVIFFCDQDDVWLPNKLETQIRALSDMEAKFGKACPILIHTDLRVADQNLNPIHDSFLAYRNIGKPDAAVPLKVLLSHNYITACATACNRSLLELAFPVPDNAIIHDWWISLCAAACGQIGFVDKPLTLYRQHGLNKIGAQGLLNFINPTIKTLKKRWLIGRRNFINSFTQAAELKKRIENRKYPVHPEIKNCIQSYLDCLNLNFLGRLKIIRKSNIYRRGMLHHVLFHMLLATITRENRTVKYDQHHG